MKAIVEKAISTLENSGTLLYPTDTIWGIGCNALDTVAIEKIYIAKERDESKNLLWLVRKDWITINNTKAQHLLTESLRPTTVIVDKTIVEPNAGSTLYNIWQKVLDNKKISTIGLRIPHHSFCQQLLSLFGKPITSTSANISGQPSPKCYNEISPVLKQRIDYCIPNMPEWESKETCGSRIVMLQANGEIKIIRE